MLPISCLKLAWWHSRWRGEEVKRPTATVTAHRAAWNLSGPQASCKTNKQRMQHNSNCVHVYRLVTGKNLKNFYFFCCFISFKGVNRKDRNSQRSSWVTAVENHNNNQIFIFFFLWKCCWYLTNIYWTHSIAKEQKQPAQAHILVDLSRRKTSPDVPIHSYQWDWLAAGYEGIVGGSKEDLLLHSCTGHSNKPWLSSLQ